MSRCECHFFEDFMKYGIFKMLHDGVYIYIHVFT